MCETLALVSFKDNLQLGKITGKGNSLSRMTKSTVVLLRVSRKQVFSLSNMRRSRFEFKYITQVGVACRCTREWAQSPEPAAMLPAAGKSAVGHSASSGRQELSVGGSHPLPPLPGTLACHWPGMQPTRQPQARSSRLPLIFETFKLALSFLNLNMFLVSPPGTGL